MRIAAPQHPYTEALLSAIPVPDPDRVRERIELSGELPSPLDPPSGCHFHPRCPFGPRVFPDRTTCVERDPWIDAVGRPHAAACHFASAGAENSEAPAA